MENHLKILGTDLLDPMEGETPYDNLCECNVQWYNDDHHSFLQGRILVKVPPVYSNEELRELCLEKVRAIK